MPPGMALFFWGGEEMKKAVVMVERCEECPFLVGGTMELPYCTKLNHTLYETSTVDDHCPLEDAERKE